MNTVELQRISLGEEENDGRVIKVRERNKGRTVLGREINLVKLSLLRRSTNKRVVLYSELGFPGIRDLLPREDIENDDRDGHDGTACCEGCEA